MDDILQIVTDKDDKKAYEKVKEILAKSKSCNEFYQYLEAFASLLENEKSYIRTRGFLLLISQAKWDKDNKIEKFLPSLVLLLHDSKPTVVRQCLNAIKGLAIYKPNLFNTIKKEVKNIDLSKYNESMSPLIAKDIEDVLNLK